MNIKCFRVGVLDGYTLFFMGKLVKKRKKTRVFFEKWEVAVKMGLLFMRKCDIIINAM